jgi:uncharacterized protein YfkK (UPF0435 family)
MEKFSLFHRTTGSPVTGDLLYRYFQYKIQENKSKLVFFLSGIHQKYSLSSKCVDNRGLRMNKQKNLTFRLILRKNNLGPIEIRTFKKNTFRFISGEPDVTST